MSESVKFILYFDDYSKQKIDVSQLNARTSDMYILYNLSELSDNILSGYSKKLVILEGALSQSNIAQELQLYKAVFDLEVFYVGPLNPADRWVTEIATWFDYSIEKISFDLLRSIVMKEVDTNIVNQNNRVPVALEIAQKIVSGNLVTWDAIPQEHATELRLVAENLLAVDQQLSEMQQKYEQECQSNLLAHQTINSLMQEKQTYVRGYSNLLSRIIEQNKKMHEFEILFKDNIYTKVDAGAYPNHPIIVYIKEHTPFVNMDKLLETLFYTLQLQDRKSVQVIRLFDSSGERRISALPKYYRVLYEDEKYMQSDTASDFICKFGDYQALLDIVLSNRINLDVLILVDSKDANDTVVSGVNVFWNACTVRDHINALELPTENTIYNDEKSVCEKEEHAWPFSQTVNLSESDEFLYLSNLPIIRKILQIARLYYEAI